MLSRRARQAGWALLGLALLVVAGWVVLRAAGVRGLPAAFQYWTNWSNVLALPISAIMGAVLTFDRIASLRGSVALDTEQRERVVDDLSSSIDQRVPDVIGPDALPGRVARQAGHWPRPTVDAVRRALAEGAYKIVLYGLPRTGKTTVAVDIMDDENLPNAVEITTSRRQPESGDTRAIAVPPLSRAESLSLLRYELDRHGIAADTDRLLAVLPHGLSSLPGALCAYVAEMRRRPPELLTGGRLPASVTAELKPIVDLVSGLPGGDAAVLGRLCLLGTVHFADALECGLFEDADSPAIGRLVQHCLTTWTDGRVEVPIVVAEALTEKAWIEATDQIAEFMHTAARKRANAKLASIVVAIAHSSVELGMFERVGVAEMGEPLNRQGHWTEYVALTQVAIRALDDAGDLARAVSERCRLSRKVAQRGDLPLASRLLADATDIVGVHGPAAVRAELHSHRAFLAHLQGDSTDALRELRLSEELRPNPGDPAAAVIARKLEGNIRLGIGDYEAAAACYTMALSIEGGDAPGARMEAEVSLAQCEMRLGNLDTAATRLDRVILWMRESAMTEELARALHVAALLAEQRGLPAQALDMARRAVDLSARDPAVRAAAQRNLWRLERFSQHGGRR